MDMYALREISLRNYDSALGASLLGHCHNSFVKYPVAHTCPYINNYVSMRAVYKQYMQTEQRSPFVSWIYGSVICAASLYKSEAGRKNGKGSHT